MGTSGTFTRRCPRRGPPTRLRVSRRLYASSSVQACVSRGVSLSRPTYVWRFRYRSCKEPRILLFGGGASRRSPWTSPSSPSSSTSVEPRPNAPFLPPFGAVATEFSFISGFYLILYLSQVLCRAAIAHHKGWILCSPLCFQ